MKQLKQSIPLILLTLVLSSTALSAPTVFPTGTTIYTPDKTWNGFTVLSILSSSDIIVIDMNGNVVKQWAGFNVSAGGPARILPGGIVVATSGAYPGHQESLELVQLDFEGSDIWRYRHNEEIENPEGEMIWSARQHHDWQREDFPAGYYSPEAEPKIQGSNTLILIHNNRKHSDVADVTLEDDGLIEVSWDGETLWEWHISDHINEFDFDEEERRAIRAAPSYGRPGANFDWMHINSATYLGPNKWFDAGDARFAPNNIIISSRQSSVMAIISHDDGSIVWQLGPDFSRTEKLRAIRQIIGQHHAHIIPKGLPGAGNLLIFDNGGYSGYGDPSPIALNGVGIYARATSRILEINPITLELIWSYSAPNFFSTNISSAQRLPNGNTLITEGAPGRVFEVSNEGENVWEYMNAPSQGPRPSNSIYRAYRLPYSWIPQLDLPEENAVTPPPANEFVWP